MENKYGENEYIFTTTDPIGREIRLKSSTFYKHITGGDHERTEFIGEEETIKKVIEDPKYILPDDPFDSSNTRERYIDLIDLRSFNTLKVLVVIVDHGTNDYGDIVTIMAKSRLNQESIKGGAVYVRTNKTRS
ncbi:hypothetical protein BHF71_02100 [Vulcanibacillus modesticaldus]|uniref:Phage-Barnase-EndoU-ColicinE5/D-RelE like nuclease 3 domain-containing protein n=1 Tax=Vulcanibacillus modesticaldus TaxID=337097 RepID=A0A1D2YUM8_9BACI|nr:hypothetical protein [Vulcanibacillus modesticaldus]OEF99399.1 hypothetical protein BHF71_02100 [Vulcanibacillus modesticaldus]